MKVPVKYDPAATAEEEGGIDNKTQMEVESVAGDTIIYRKEKVDMLHFLFCCWLL